MGLKTWYEQRRDHQKKDFTQRAVEAAVLIYAGFAICFMASIAECLTIPASSKFQKLRSRYRKMRGRNESR